LAVAANGLAASTGDPAGDGRIQGILRSSPDHKESCRP